MALLGRLLQKRLRVGAQRRRVQRVERRDAHQPAARAPRRAERRGVDDREAARARARLDELQLGLRAGGAAARRQTARRSEQRDRGERGRARHACRPPQSHARPGQYFALAHERETSRGHGPGRARKI